MCIELTIERLRQIPRVVGQQRVCAIAVDENGRRYTAVNSYTKTHPIMQHFAKLAESNEEKCYLHAEVAAVLKAKTKRVVEVYVARILADSMTPGMAKPCPTCEAALRAFGVKRVIYTTGNSMMPVSHICLE